MLKLRLFGVLNPPPVFWYNEPTTTPESPRVGALHRALRFLRPPRTKLKKRGADTFIAREPPLAANWASEVSPEVCSLPSRAATGECTEVKPSIIAREPPLAANWASENNRNQPGGPPIGEPGGPPPANPSTAPPADLLEIYRRLHGHFGHRRWWPGETPFEVAIGAILTQSVAWTNVERAIGTLKAAGIFSPEGLRGADQSHLAQLIRPSRYPNVKARKLKAFVGFLEERYAGDMAVMARARLPGIRDELLAVWGIGPETADSILLYALEKPVFVVDAYTRRIFARLGFWDERVTYAAMQETFHRLSPDVPLYNDYHAQIVALGNTLCFPRKPRCGECPLVRICRFEPADPPENSSGR